MGNQQNAKPQQGFGYRILAIDPDSEGSRTNLSIFTDFIIDAQPVIVNRKPLNFVQLIGSQQAMNFKIYNIMDDKERSVTFGIDNHSLGLTVRLESYEQLLQLRVSEVLENSPSEQMGLEKQTDYIIGVLEQKCYTLDQFTNIIQETAHQEGSVNVCVYSVCRQPSVRVIKLEPRMNWGGPGCIGCEFATGALHSVKSPHLTVLHDMEVNQGSRKESRRMSESSIEQVMDTEENLQENNSLQQIQDEILINKDLVMISADDLKYGQIYTFKGVPRYAGKENQAQDQINLSSSIGGNQWLTDDPDSQAHHSQNLSQSSQSFIQQEEVLTNISNVEQYLKRSQSEPQQPQLELLKSDSFSFKSTKREINYSLDVNLLFNVRLEIESNPIYLY